MWLRAGFRALRRLLTGETIQRLDTEVQGGLGVLSLRLKRDKRHREEYVILAAHVSHGNWYYVFELDEFDLFIAAADDIRAAQTYTTAALLEEPRTLGKYTDMVLTGEVVRRFDTKILGGLLTISLRLKREKDTGREYIVLATLALGMYLYYPFELDDFHRFIASAKKIRSTSHSSGIKEQQA